MLNFCLSLFFCSWVPVYTDKDLQCHAVMPTGFSQSSRDDVVVWRKRTWERWYLFTIASINFTYSKGDQSKLDLSVSTSEVVKKRYVLKIVIFFTHVTHKSFRAYCRMQENDRIRILSANFCKRSTSKTEQKSLE